MKRLSSIISAVFSPLFIPTYGVAMALYTTVLYYVGSSTRWWVILCTLAFTAVIPMLVIFALHRLGRISDPGLNNRNERTVPYVVSLICYAGTAIYLWSVHAPMWLVMFIAGGGVALLAAMIINLWWKISAHAAGMGGLLALGFHILVRSLNVWPMQWLVMTLVVLAGVVCMARLVLKRHTLGQLAAGFTLGFLCVLLATDI